MGDQDHPLTGFFVAVLFNSRGKQLSQSVNGIGIPGFWIERG